MMRIALIAILMVFSVHGIDAQEEYTFPPLSPKATITQEVGFTNISMEYERPCARNRKIWGELVPWNAVWRMGAGYCTKIRFDKTVTIEGSLVSPGTYSVFSIPNPDNWVIILNSDTTLYGSWRYDMQKDVSRFIVTPDQTDRFYESLTYEIEVIPNNARLHFSWLNTHLQFDIETSTDADIETYITEELLSGKNKNAGNYAGAADYYFYQDTQLEKGVRLADMSLELDPNHGWARNVKILLLEKLTRYDDALEEIANQKAQINNNTYEKEKYRTDELNQLKDIEVRIRSKM